MGKIQQKEIRFNKRWSRSEDLRLARQIQAFPQNLHKCFMIVAEELGRTESAVAGRWYQHVSKSPSNLCFFTASPKHVSKNRKNGMGVESNPGIWRRLMTVLRSLTH
jgi:hypothetical protein